MDDAEITRKNIEFFRSSGSHSLLELQIKSTKAQIRSLARSRFIQYKQFNVCVFIYGINAGVRGKKTIIRYEDCEREKNVYKMEEKRWKDIKSADDRTKREGRDRGQRGKKKYTKYAIVIALCYGHIVKISSRNLWMEYSYGHCAVIHSLCVCCFFVALHRYVCNIIFARHTTVRWNCADLTVAALVIRALLSYILHV